jgi:formiminotetrahydrofolate cyclodeaminase
VAHGHNAAKRGIAVTLASFIAEVADHTPAPGGGAAAGAGCALGAALAEMAARFGELEEPATRAAALRGEALALAEADRTAYEPVLSALRLPAGDPHRDDALASARSAAADVPLAIAEAAAATAELARDVAAAGKAVLRGDALAGADLAAGAARAAARLVEINLEATPEDPRVTRAREAVARAAG